MGDSRRDDGGTGRSAHGLALPGDAAALPAGRARPGARGARGPGARGRAAGLRQDPARAPAGRPRRSPRARPRADRDDPLPVGRLGCRARRCSGRPRVRGPRAPR
ncbi:hypothetical protein EAH85_03115 [Curtobacterium flaccumfaciens]|nr:hypothetical protein EAH85_03115 [Curtobacterium flaccumfaciens]